MRSLEVIFNGRRLELLVEPTETFDSVRSTTLALEQEREPAHSWNILDETGHALQPFDQIGETQKVFILLPAGYGG